jgi:hypothetical protein
MKNRNNKMNVAVALMVVALMAIPSLGFCQKNQNKGGEPPKAGLNCLINYLPVEELSPEEEAGILHRREEEKLARDVYAAMYENWQDPMFNVISQIENRHMNTVKLLIDKYGLADPVTDPTAGVFTDPQMLALYAQLVEQGSVSLTEALKAGAAIEDMDIHDLKELLAQADNKDIKLIYGNLLRASQNHLRAFVYRLSLVGVTYEAQYITPEELEAIILSPREKCEGDGDMIPGSGSGRAGQEIDDGV